MPLGGKKLYTFGDFRLDPEQRLLLCNGDLIPLAPKVFNTLLALVESKGRVLEKDELLKTIWTDTFVEENSLTQNISNLRKVLGEETNGPQYIQTIPKRGYRFLMPVTPVEAEPERAPQLEAAALAGQWRKLAVASVVVIMLVGGAVLIKSKYLWPKQPVPLDLSAYRYRPFAFTQGYEHAGAWSPDGKNIAFLLGGAWGEQSWRGGHLMVQPADGGVATQLVERVDFPHLRWSQDGNRVYYRNADGVYSVSRAGGQPELILKADGYTADFDMSPDGKSLAVWRAPRGADGSTRGSVWVSSPPGTEPREYTPASFAVPAALGATVHFSPDGKVLFASMVTFNGNAPETWLLPFPAGSGSPRRIFRNVIWSGFVPASWMPDGRRMVVRSKAALWLADTRDETLTKLTDGSVQVDDPNVSPDGNSLLFTRIEEDTDIIELPLDGSAPRKLLATGASEYSPAWSPKGGAFAYLTQRNGKEELWLRSATGDWERRIAGVRELPKLAMFGTPPVISPDGTRIAYGPIQSDPKHIGSVYVSPAAGGVPTWIADGSMATWSPDGASITFMWRKPSGAGALATMRVGSDQQPVEIPNVTCVPPIPVWSPSGEWIACPDRGGGSAILVTPDGKVKREVPHFRAFTLAWSKDGKTLYGLHEEDANWSLLAADVRSGATRKVADYGHTIAPYSGLPYFGLSLSLSPDGKSFAVGNLKRQTAVWILEGFPK